MSESDKGAEDGTNGLNCFVFPSILSEGFRFNSVEQVKEYLSSEARRAADPARGELFKFSYSRSNSYSMRLKCRYCPCFICLLKEEGWLMVTKFMIEHRHGIEVGRTRLQDKVFRYLRGQYKRNEDPRKVKRRRKSEQPTFPIDERQYATLVEKFEHQELRDFGYLEALFKKQKCVTACDWGDNARRQGYPNIIVTATVPMVSNFERYGDLLCFDVLYHVLKNESEGRKFKVGIFSVMDSNLRILVAGAAIICQEVSVNLSKVFEMFFEIQRAQPKTIVTDQHGGLYNAIKLLQERGVYRGGHILDTHHYLRKVKTKLKENAELAYQVCSTMGRVMQTRNPEDFQINLRKLQAMVPSQELYDDFVGKLDKLTFLEGPRTFVGIRRVSLQKINGQMKRYLSKPTTIVEMARIVSKLCSILTNRSNKSFEQMSQQTYVELEDPRLAAVKAKVENFVMTVFLENYVSAQHEFAILEQIEDKDTDTFMFTLESRVSGRVVEVLDWECRCGELLRTGVPCPHLIACAIVVPKKSYLDFFHKRWIKEVMEGKKEAADKLSTVGTKTAGLFKSLETMYI